MKNTYFYLAALVALLASCDAKTSQTSDNSHSQAESETGINGSAQTDQKESNKAILDLIANGSYALPTNKIEKIHEYGAGDCWGTVTKYSLPNHGLAIDSLNCGDYGYTFTYYLLSQQDQIQGVFIKKSETSMDGSSNTVSFILLEQIIDFTAQPPVSMTKTETVSDYDNKVIKAPYVTLPLDDQKATYAHWEMEYNRMWELGNTEM